MNLQFQIIEETLALIVRKLSEIEQFFVKKTRKAIFVIKKSFRLN